jgi:hypothetical protein
VVHQPIDDHLPATHALLVYIPCRAVHAVHYYSCNRWCGSGLIKDVYYYKQPQKYSFGVSFRVGWSSTTTVVFWGAEHFDHASATRR